MTGVNVTEWHGIPAADMEPVYHAEADRWRETLAWETTPTWHLVERSRRRGLVPGYVVRDGRDRISGWSFHLCHRQTLQIGALCASSVDVTGALVEAVLTSPEARQASRAMAFTLAGAPGLESTLERQGFSVGTYRYLHRNLVPQPAAVVALDRATVSTHILRVWRPDDAAAVGRLLASAYAEPDRLRPFGGDGRPDEWTEYLSQLTTQTGCGRFHARHSLVAFAANGGIDGAALVTDLGGRTAHLAQLVVAPGLQGRGLGRRLLTEAMVVAARAGFERMTLLMSDRNTRAGGLYAAAGFEERAVFLTAAD